MFEITRNKIIRQNKNTILYLQETNTLNIKTLQKKAWLGLGRSYNCKEYLFQKRYAVYAVTTDKNFSSITIPSSFFSFKSISPSKKIYHQVDNKKGWHVDAVHDKSRALPGINQSFLFNELHSKNATLEIPENNIVDIFYLNNSHIIIEDKIREFGPEILHKTKRIDTAKTLCNIKFQDESKSSIYRGIKPELGMQAWSNSLRVKGSPSPIVPISVMTFKAIQVQRLPQSLNQLVECVSIH